MTPLRPWHRFVPFLLVALSLIALSSFTAISLVDQQSGVTRLLRENVESQRASMEMEDCLVDLIVLEDAHIETVTVLHERARKLLLALRRVADQEPEQRLLKVIESSFEEYLQRWRNLPEPGHSNHEKLRKEATRFLEESVFRPAQEFENHTKHEIEVSAEDHERFLRRLAWGVAVVGVLGGISGIVLGFGTARSLTRSLRELHIQLRGAAGKLNPAVQEIVVTEQGDFRGLHAEVDQLAGRIEQVVRELQDREREVLRAEQLAAVGQLAAGVAHEIRNPLTSIKLLVQAVKKDKSGLSDEELDMIEGEVRRMETSLQTFLDFARPPKLHRTLCVVADLLDAVYDLTRPRAEKQRVKLINELPRIAVVVDPGLFRQVFLNLCLNALDMMPTGGTLRVTAKVHADRLELEFADSGPGISTAMFPNLFQPFSSSKETGLGLGLVISQRIVEEHGGRMNAANRPEGGASFFLSIPLESADAERPAH